MGLSSVTSAKVIQAFWDAIQARDWVGVRALLADDVVLDWPVSKERIVGASNVVAVNAEYPEGWTIRVLRIDGDGDGDAVASEVEVEVTMVECPVSRSAAFWTVVDGRIAGGVEYWTEIGADPAPAWRAPYVHHLPT